MAVECTPNALADASKCFCVLDKTQQVAIELYLLATLAGGSMDPAVLSREAAAAGFMGIGDKTVQDGLRLYLLCQAATAAGA